MILMLDKRWLMPPYHETQILIRFAQHMSSFVLNNEKLKDVVFYGCLVPTSIVIWNHSLQTAKHCGRPQPYHMTQSRNLNGPGVATTILLKVY